MNRVAQRGIHQRNQKQENNPGKKILVIEDEASLLHTLAFTLKRKGFHVTKCMDGKTALNLVHQSQANETGFDLIITDIQLPKLSGLDLIDELKKSGIVTPVFVMTNYGSRELVIELFRRGCRDYLDKPFNTKKLMDRVYGILDAPGSGDGEG